MWHDDHREQGHGSGWDGDEGAHWAENAERYEHASRRTWEQFLEQVPIAPEVRGALALGRDLPSTPPGMPGPCGFANSDHVRRVLGDAGLADVQLTELGEPIEFGTDADDAYSFMRTMGVVKGLTADLGEAARERGMSALRETLAAHETPDGVLLGTAVWLVEAALPPA